MIKKKYITPEMAEYMVRVDSEIMKLSSVPVIKETETEETEEPEKPYIDWNW